MNKGHDDYVSKNTSKMSDSVVKTISEAVFSFGTKVLCHIGHLIDISFEFIASKCLPQNLPSLLLTSALFHSFKIFIFYLFS